MKAARFDLCRAESSEAAAALLEAHDGSVKLLAGGQSLGPMLNLRLVCPQALIDIRQCSDLRTCGTSQDAVLIGAGVTHAEVEDRRVPDLGSGWLAQAARGIAYRTIRNRGTVGGSLAHADPAADWLPILMSFGAEVIVRSAGGLHAERLCDFVTGPFQTRLGPADILVAVRIDRPSPAARWGHHKVSVKKGEFAIAMASVMHDPERGVCRAAVGAIERAPLVLEGLNELVRDPTPAAAERLLRVPLAGLPATGLRLHAVALSRAARRLARGGERAGG